MDHLLFIVSFCLMYSIDQWKKVLGLVTAFTIGHSLTLILSGIDIISHPSALIETLILLSILATCLINFYDLYKGRQMNFWLSYFVLLLFGCIHGMGFSNYLKQLLFEDEGVIAPLVGFNFGIELAQILIVAVFLFLIWLTGLISKKATVYLRWFLNAIVLFFCLKWLFF